MTNFFDFTNMDPGSGVFAEIGKLSQRLSGLEGRASSDDGRVSAVYTSAAGLAELHLDPRAMRLGSAELAELIVEVTRKAKEDLETRSREVMADMFGPEAADVTDAMRDPELIKDRMDAMRETFEKALDDSTALLERLRRSTGQ